MNPGDQRQRQQAIRVANQARFAQTFESGRFTFTRFNAITDGILYRRFDSN